MSAYYFKVAKYLDNNPLIVYNIKQFRALLLDLTENDIPLANLIITSTIDGLHFKISKLKKTQRSEIMNFIHSFTIRYSIDPKKEDTLFEFYANVFAEREIPELPQNVEEKLDPIINLNLKSIATKQPPKAVNYYTPCGTDKKDFGFNINGIKETDISNNQFSNIYSIVFSILQRSIVMAKSNITYEFEKKIKHEVNYSLVYRFEIILLLLIKNNYDRNNIIEINYDGDLDDINCAVYEINHFSNIIAKLSNISFNELEVIFTDNGIKLSKNESFGEISYQNETKHITPSRLQWNENSLIYNISNNNEYLLDILLSELFSYEKFLPGQKECLIKILNNNNSSSITILPVGGGKSLIYYFLAYLKSCPTFVVTPSRLLIADQIRNLKLFHNLDDAIQLTYDMNFKNYLPANKLIYITPKAFLNRELLCRLIKLNFKQLIGNIILDEVHCISNWGHDFKPEYLMLSYNLNEFLSNISYSCFTGTANYKVIKDIKDQLNINIDSILCPISLKNNAFNFEFNQFDNEDDLIEKASIKINKDSLDEENKRTIIFTKTQFEANKLYGLLDETGKTNVDLSNGLFSSYHDFIKGNTNALICGETFGMGINLPRINSIIHIGSPLSKSQYVQEIGRAARNKESSDTTIYYLSNNAFAGLNSKIIDKSIPTIKLIELFNDNSFSEEGKAIISKLFGNIENKNTFTEKVLDLSIKLQKLQKDGRVAFKIPEDKNFDNEISKINRYLYILFRIGYIFGWYFDSIDETNRLVTYYIDPGKEKPTLDSMIYKTCEYLNRMGEYKNTTTSIKHSRKIQTIIKEYIDWYYTQLLYYHREQYLEMLDFLNNYNKKSNKQISNEINHYFSLSLLNIQKSTFETNSLSIGEIFNLASNNLKLDILDNIKQSIENEYSNRLDLYILINNYLFYNIFDINRFIRILDNSSSEERDEILINLPYIFDKFLDEEKLSIINTLIKYHSFEKILQNLYDNSSKDMVYYYILAKIANNEF